MLPFLNVCPRLPFFTSPVGRPPPPGMPAAMSVLSAQRWARTQRPESQRVGNVVQSIQPNALIYEFIGWGWGRHVASPKSSFLVSKPFYFFYTKMMLFFSLSKLTACYFLTSHSSIPVSTPSPHRGKRGNLFRVR